MTEIPDDVMEASEDVAIAISKTDGGLIDSTSIIASAIMAERERCARIADMTMYGATAADIIRNN